MPICEYYTIKIFECFFFSHTANREKLICNREFDNKSLVWSRLQHNDVNGSLQPQAFNSDVEFKALRLAILLTDAAL